MRREIIAQTSLTNKNSGWSFTSPTALLRWLFLPLLVAGLTACERSGPVIAPSQYQAILIGNWQGTVGVERETMSFAQGGQYTAQLLREGFISTTLGQGEAGTINGTWTLKGNVITLAIDNTDNVEPINNSTESTIIEFKQNKLTVSSAGGETSTFIRVR